MPQIKEHCGDWSNKSKLKIMFLMNYWKCPRWFKTRKKTLTENWWYFLKTKYDFWLMNFFRFYFRLTWVTSLTQRIWCWCTAQQSLLKKKWSKSWKNWIQIKHLNWTTSSIDFWNLWKWFDQYINIIFLNVH